MSGNDGVREVENLEGLSLRTNEKLPYFTAALAGALCMHANKTMNHM